MQYSKPAITFEAQADQLIARGLEADKDELVRRLSAVSYYRLAGYWYPFRARDENENVTDEFEPGSQLAKVWQLYCFDRRLRGLLMDGIERIEVSVRTQLVYHFTHEYGPFGYCQESNLPKLSVSQYLEWRQGLAEETRRSKEPFRKHFETKYGDKHQNLPLWMLAELMTMGSMLTFFRGVSPDIKRSVAAKFEIPDEVMMSWLRSLNAARNHCAHHSRVWNRVFGYPPQLPSAKYPEWHSEYWLPNDRCGVLLLMCRHLLRIISPTSKWHERLEGLFMEYDDVPIKPMGLPPNWRDHPVWVKS